MGAVVGEDSLKLDSVGWSCMMAMTMSWLEGSIDACDMMMMRMTAFEEKGKGEEKDRHAHSQKSGRSVLIGSRILMHSK